MYITEEQELVRETARDFAEREIKPIAQQLDEEERFDVNMVRKMGEMGFFGMIIPEKYGGKAMQALSYIIAVEELARVDGSHAATLAAHNSLGIRPIFNFGTEEQKQKYLPSLCSGEGLWAFGLTEPEAGSDSRGTKTTAKFENGKWIINGSKIFITNGSTPVTKGITVQAVTGKDENGNKIFSTFLLESGTKGFHAKPMKKKLMWRASDTSELFFDNCEIPEENLLGKVGQGLKIMLRTLDSGRLSIAAMGLGCAQGAYEEALNYAKNRKQFGKPISKFQNIAFRLADMYVKIELARSFLYRACWLKENNKPFSLESAIAKLYCSEVARDVADEAVQIHGGYGLMKDYPVERFYRDQRLLRIGEGTSEIQRLIISRHIGC
jgi:alkylation response protein AidB-like acyl-CoA dehydrogenase